MWYFWDVCPDFFILQLLFLNVFEVFSAFEPDILHDVSIIPENQYNVVWLFKTDQFNSSNFSSSDFSNNDDYMYLSRGLPPPMTWLK